MSLGTNIAYSNLRRTHDYSNEDARNYRGQTPLREPVPFHSKHYSPVEILVRLILAPQWRKSDPTLFTISPSNWKIYLILSK